MHPSSLFHPLNDAHCHSVPSQTVSYIILFKVPISKTSVVVDLAAPLVIVANTIFHCPLRVSSQDPNSLDFLTHFQAFSLLLVAVAPRPLQ